MLHPPTVRFLLLFTLIALAGCGKMSETKLTLTEAQKKFDTIIQDELKIPIITRQTGQTLWIYVPIEENFILYKASPTAGTSSNNNQPPSDKPSLKFVEALYTKPQFDISYDISTGKSYAKDLGYATDYSDSFKKMQQNIMSALQRAFEGSENPPLFVGIVASDIKNGVEIESIIYLQDLLKAMSMIPSLPQDEFTKRYLNEFRGDQQAIGDKEGKHLSYHDITMGEFISKQIENRIRFKYQQSAFGPSSDTRQEILNATQEALDAYDFKDYESINLKDLTTQESYSAKK